MSEKSNDTEEHRSEAPHSSAEQQTKEPEVAPKITNDTVETDPVRKVVNKKLSTMSKESKERKKNRKRILKNPDDKFKFPNVNPMYLLTAIGVIIAGLSLYCTRKNAIKEEAENERNEGSSKQENEKPKTKHKQQGTKGPDHMDPFFVQQHKNTGIYTFDD